MALEIEIDGKKLTVPDGSTVMEAAHQIGTYIPHFCYHKKLSIAANCRMCLVEVEKAPKPLPACATPVTDGMKVFTHSDLAVKAQKGVMEFLLINHPLDCPICDQGGECQLQDLAVGYGGSESRYQEKKRTLVPKDMGPLVSAEEMARCIHCTRCVRFTEEIGGFQEIGMAHRGEFSEILPFLGKTVNSEISGNVIDLCPVGALTSKPFRYSARNWELSRRRSVSPHDGLGANLIVQVKRDRVYRVLPYENEDVNECWLADRDRFSYEALNSDQRLTVPMVKQGGEWIETDWAGALDYASHGLKDVLARYSGDQIAFAASEHATTEELFLFKKLARALGIKSTDTRFRRTDFSADKAQTGALWFGEKIADLEKHDAILVIGSNLRKEQPLLAARVRQAVKHGQHLHVLHCSDDDWLCTLASKQIVSPAQLAVALQDMLNAVKNGDSAVKLTDQSLIVLGNVAQHHPQFATLLRLANALAESTGARVGVLAEAANSVGAELFFRPDEGGANASEMFAEPKHAYFLLNTDLDLDCANATLAHKAVKQAKLVVAMSAFKTDGLLDYADVLLPISPFTETAGTFINMEGRAQSFNGVVKPQGQTRPAWKVLRVLGSLLGVNDFEYETIESVRAEALSSCQDGFVLGLNNQLQSGDTVAVEALSVPEGRLQLLSEVPLYQSDILVRHAASLQKTLDAKQASLAVNAQTLKALGLEDGASVRVEQDGNVVVSTVACDNALPDQVARVRVAQELSAGLGQMFGHVTISREA